MKRLLFAAILAALWPAAGFAASPELRQTDLFVSKTDGYHTYRIPSIVIAKNGAILAFCEGRKESRSDAGDIDILLKRSTDGGKTWSASQTIWDDGENTCGNPCAVVDKKTGIVWLMLTHNLGSDKESAIEDGTARGGRTVWICKSSDHGKTWSKPRDITRSVKSPDWRWYATGPGVGIQISGGPNKGRLIIPCDNSCKGEKFSHLIFSDDHGMSWQIGGVTGPKMNECQVVELAGGKGALLLNMRSYREKSCRAESISENGGLTLTPPADAPALVEPVCQASILRCDALSGKNRDVILFSNPADPKKRQNMTVRLSRDNCKSWPVSRTIHAGPAAYSCLTVLPDKTIGCLYECGKTNSVEKIVLASFPLDWLSAP